ncbi:MAG: type II secretion system F family protein [Phycisphaerae bacterium]|nr:type II secretion system F family protein [Phycisphaerae bacterium]
MPTFAYKALSAHGQDVAAEVEATDRAAAVRELAARGVCVTDIRESGGRVASLFKQAPGQRLRVRPKRLANLTRQLAVSLEAGLPLMTALEVMGEELDHAPSCELLKRLGQRVQQGESLSDALAEHPNIFPPLYIHLVRVGEAGGVLETVLSQLADMLERQVELRERVKSASIYPAVLLLVGIVSVIIIVTVIMPRIIESLGVETFLLPWPTRVLMGFGDFIGAYGWWLLIVLIIAVIAWRQLVLRGAGRPAWDATKLRIPILGRLTRQAEAARFARGLGILAHGGVTITEALAVVQDTLQNAVLCGAVRKLAESVKSGESIARPLQRCGLFPPLLVQMVRVGENTGRLDEMLLRAADVHESEARITLDRLVNVLPVLMILALAVIIGFIVAGLVLAIVEFQTTGFGA